LRQEIASENLFVLFIFCDPTDNFDVSKESCVFTFADFGETATLPLNLLTQSGGTKFTYIMMVAIHNLVVELYVRCTVK